MKDIDFDELDRAVSSLMSGAPKVDPIEGDDDAGPTLAVKTSSDDDTPPQADAQPYVAEVSGETPVIDEAPARLSPPVSDSGSVAPTPIATPPASFRRRGRFMDMVRPAATESTRSNPSRPLSRQGATVSPTDGFIRSSASETPNEAATDRPADAQSQETDWNDPLKAIDFDKTSEAIEVKSNRSESRPWQSGMQTASKETQELSALAPSPFLPDAKVEKRPLGGQTAEIDTSLPSAAEGDNSPVIGIGDDMRVTTAHTDTSSDMAVPEQPLPAELGHDVMAIESAISGEADDRHDAVESSPKPQQVSPAVTLSPPASSRPAFTSIPQQYKIQPKETDTAPGAIYDTATYHQPLSHPAKKQSDWVWFLGFILLLLLGAAGGAAVYFFDLF